MEDKKWKSTMKQPTEQQKLVEDRLEVLDILKHNLCSIAYNPNVEYYHITFNIHDEEEMQMIRKWLGTEEQECK